MEAKFASAAHAQEDLFRLLEVFTELDFKVLFPMIMEMDKSGNSSIGKGRKLYPCKAYWHQADIYLG